MKIVDYKTAGLLTTPHKVDASKLYDTQNATVIHITLKPGEHLLPHITPVDVFFYILEGNPTIQVGKKRIEVARDNLIESPAKVKHCIFHETDKVARILVVKVPKPKQKTIIL